MTHDELFALATQIAPHLRGVWNVTKREGYQTAATLTDTVISFDILYTHKGKLNVQPSQRYSPQINISPTRPPKQIAADIERRLIPLLREQHRQDTERERDHRREQQEREELIAAMNQAANFSLIPSGYNHETLRSYSHLLYWKHPALTVDIEHDNEIAISLKRLPRTYAEKLITAFVTAYPPPPKCECGEYAKEGSIWCEECEEEKIEEMNQESVTPRE